VLAFLLRLIPKVGPLRDLSLRVPSADAQKTFLTGMNSVVDRYQHYLDQLHATRPDRPSLNLPSLDLDTGKPTAPAEYALADQTYARYLSLLVKPRPPAPPPRPSAPWSGPESAGTQTPGTKPEGAPPAASKPPVPAQPNATQPDASQSDAQQAPPKPALQPIDPAIRRDIERYFARTGPGQLLLKKNQWKNLPSNLQTLRQLPEAPPSPPTAPSS
jgi:hypothetical protein